MKWVSTTVRRQRRFGEGDASEPALDLGFAARKLGQISRSLICLTGHTRADPSTPDRCGDPFYSFVCWAISIAAPSS